MRHLALAAALGLTAGVSAFATPALAQEGYNSEIYGGVIAGWDRLHPKAAGTSGNKDGVVYGGVIGIQTSSQRSFQFGVEAEATGSTVKERDNNVFAVGDNLRLKMGRDLFIGFRAGVRPSPGLLVYGKMGYTNARMTTTYASTASGFENRQNLSGYRAAGGIEVGQGRLRFRGEYRFSNYGDLKFNNQYTGINLQRHQVVGGAIFMF